MSLQWKCDRCGQGSWLHHETCASCGMNKPAPPPAEIKAPSNFSRPETPDLDPA